MKYSPLIVILMAVATLDSVLPANEVRTSSGYRYSLAPKSSRELLRLTKKLRSAGARVALTSERVKQAFFAPAARIMNINGEGVQVFEYSKVSAAAKDAMLVSSDGMTIGTSKPSWMAPPHFFRSGRLIVIYVGNEETILRLLQGALGKQFAGQ
jgi:hypothetical protein